MKNTGKEAEEQYLKHTLKVISKNLETYSRESARMQEEIDEMLEHYHDNDVELWTILNNTITLNEHMKRALERNERAKGKPYFGRIIFHDETLDKDESLYIGKGGISIDRTRQVVVDWRAPVSNAYYENGLGRCSYTAPDGKLLPIDLQLKRTFEIEDGKLLDYFDTEVVANDDLLMKYLSRNKEAVLGEIVATIQKEQNEIIRKSPYHNMIVQGVAGSGKTTVAMHRISYILYNYKERFRPEDFYIVGSNRILLNYITGVLPDLDVYGVRQMTMEQLFVRLLYEDWDEKKYKIKSVSDARDTIKGTEKWYQDLLSFIRRLEKQYISTDSIYLNPRQFVEGLQDGKNGVYDRSGEDNAAGRSPRLVELVSGAAVERYVNSNPGISIQSKINMLNDRLMTKIKDEFLGKAVKYTDAERKAILKAYRGKYGVKSWKESIFRLYESFLSEQQTKGYNITVSGDSYDVYDLASLALLYKYVKETEVISEAHHIVIDEAQDFGMMAYHALYDCIKDCTYTIMGDVSQNIHFGYGLGDWEALRQLILSDPMDSFGILKKSYRNTVEISDFATNILRHGNFSIYPVEPIIRHGNRVEVKKAAGTESEFAENAAQVCRSWQENGYDTIAVVCRNKEEAAYASAELSKHIDIMDNDLEKANFGTGIMVLPVEYTKGLEFDAVLIWAPTGTGYPVDDGHARLLYVAATRALHELCILYRDELTGLIADPVPKSTPNYHTEKKEAIGKAPASGSEERPYKVSYPQKPRVKLAVTENKGATVVQKKKEPAADATPAKVKREPVAGEPQFGDMPATEMLRPKGHAKINSSIRWVSKQSDGLYLQSQYGILRISPVGSAIMRITFARGSKILEYSHPPVAARHMEKGWKYRDLGKKIEISAAEVVLQIDKASGFIQYLDNAGRLLLSERKSESRQQEANQNWLFLEFQKNEQLYGMDPGGQGGLKLRGSARYIGTSAGSSLPFILSDRGYGILPAAEGSVICCDVPAYGSYIYTETEQMDYYFIAGKQQKNIINAYSYLCGLL